VQSIDVLRREQELRRAALDLDQRPMPRVRRDARGLDAALRIPVPDELRIALERRRRGELARIECRPQSGERIAERRHAGLGGDPGPGQHGDEARRREPARELGGNLQRWNFGGHRALSHARRCATCVL
jgi:hypothetical protein